MFSPVKASPLPARFTTGVEARDDEEGRARRERAQHEQRAELQAHQSRYEPTATPGAAAASSFHRSFNSGPAAAPAYPSYTPHASGTQASLQHMTQRHTPSRYAPQDYHDPPVSSAAGFQSSSPLLSRASQQHLQSLALSQSQSRQAPLTTEQLQ
jgi:hypothetical protein